MRNRPNRIRSKSHTSSPKNQGCPNTAAGHVLVEPGIKDGAFSSDEPVYLILFDLRSDATVAGAGISPKKLAALRRKSKTMGLPIGALLARAINHLVVADKPKKLSKKELSAERNAYRSQYLHITEEQPAAKTWSLNKLAQVSQTLSRWGKELDEMFRQRMGNLTLPNSGN